ncbi:2-keto-4-pentenoate hydratase [Pseudogracilibacillus sp. SO10305]|uniref:2-keto-4-pentenoate hydratase n=1 Tax=Pseudogracilibacillus sp. SO10305 TaxID=3098292 RepID=UPI00300DBFB5
MDTIKDYAAQLYHAEKNRKQMEPLTETNPSLTVEHAYEIQLEIAKQKLAEGNSIIGKKVGLTSKAMQDMLQVNEPDYGHLFKDMELANKAVISTETMIAPKIEAEIGFVLKEDLVGPNITFLDVLMATDYVVPTLEVIDSRIKDWKIKLIDTVADNGSSAKVVIGEGKKYVHEVNVRTVGMTLFKNDEMISTGAGAAALGHPAEAIAWLANKLSSFDIVLKKGELILPGALSGAVQVEAGAHIKADFGALGSVEVSFE